MENIFYIIIGACVVFCFLYPKIKKVQQIDQAAKHSLEVQLSSLEAQKRELLNSINDLDQQSQHSAKVFLEQNINLAKERLDRSLEQISTEYQKAEETYTQDYLEVLKDASSTFTETLNAQKQELEISQNKINELKNNVQASIEASKRAEEIRQKADFYRLNVPEEDVLEIKHLRSIEPFLRNKEPLNKVIWKCYYEKPLSDLIGRVVGSSIKTGIYKITNLENQMCYIGQAVNIADRWKQHIKRGVGADTPTRNKLYPAMLSFGVENFSFEIIEECGKTILNEREDYWQDFFKAKEFGYSMK